MATRYPPDRFDTLPNEIVRVGAHRAPGKRGRGWVGFAWAALATGILVAAGIFALTTFSASLNLPFSDTLAQPSTPVEPSETPAQTAEPVLDATVTITVLNGTVTPRLANTAADRLVALGWCGAAGAAEPEDGECAGQTSGGTRADAATKDITATVVYYSDAASEGAARGIARDLGVGTVQLSDVYAQAPSVEGEPPPITVVVGADYAASAG